MDAKLTGESLRVSEAGRANVTPEDFVVGFNQGNERFMMVDVGHDKGAVDAKIKGVPVSPSSGFIF